ncbi:MULTISPECIES: class I SAM-dependent methyltransferase [Planktothricoides]|uniref:Class I SAM-dependent methyltransferase n=1 Tax=Planktothricoides raciborskii FACHB-1370 TaxID=2949576 RepID=A0ABR8E737_9CYAN|nr:MULTISPECIES: class I SAM-dependent methyltransferase [Planktothricoides]MBD2542508.1 class I SAM-dependent methyltransferase [Planktothricoides raciborskii FACHB-1370]MBD2580965.1 class I SAM-dependent methyltransferase [Planktothricoides raciborskii FACHB-1261]
MIAQTISTPKLTIVNGQGAKKSNRTVSAVIREQIVTELTNKFLLRGELIMPCIPSMKHYYFQRVNALFNAFGIKPTSEKLKELYQQILAKINQGFQESPHSRIRIKYESILEPERGITFNIGLMNYSVVAQYQDWLKNRKPPFFGTHPDAKLMAIAAAMNQPPQQIKVLDIGAGTGRNTIPLANLGYPVDAVELTPEFAEQIQQTAEKSNLPVRVIKGNVLDSRQVKLRPANYQIILISEVICHLRTANDLRQIIAKMSDLLAPGGLLLFNSFLPIGDYEPKQFDREIAQSEISTIFTYAELAWAMDKLPLKMISDESAFDYEHQHLPIEAWPPTGWYCDWATGRDAFWKALNRPPIELRWILCQRT